jgi:AcrR family transcriptional regulator
MLEIVAERGYEAVTVRELARLAGVSTRTFYEHYAGKEECFQRAYELIVRRIVRRIVAVQVGESDWRERLRLTFDTFVSELQRDQRAARLLLVEVYAAGTESLEQVHRAEHTFETRVAECFDGGPAGIEMPSLLVKGIAAGMICTCRARLLEGRESELSQLAGDLTEWASSFYSEAAIEAVELGRRDVREDWAKAPPVTSSKGPEEARSPAGDRALILSAVAKLAARASYGRMTVAQICLVAGLSRRRFDLQYGGVEECLADALELRAAAAFARAAEAGCRSDSREHAVQSSMSVLCHAITDDPVLAKLGFGDGFGPGLPGPSSCDHIIARIDELISGDTSGLPPDRTWTNASAAAIWGLLRNAVTGKGGWRTSRLIATLSLLALTPAAVDNPSRKAALAPSA